MPETAGAAGTATLPTDSPVTSDDIAAFANAEADSSPAPSTDAVAPAPATAESATSGSTVTDTAGPLPFERHKAILEHARTEARAEAEREWRQRFGWAEKYQPEMVEQGNRLYQWLNQNPQAFLTWLRGQMGEDVRERSATRADDTGPPQPDLRAEDGTPVYSAPQLQKLMEWKDREYKQLLEPLQQKWQEREDRERLSQTAREAKASASGLLKQARESWPLFAQLEPQVLRAMQADPRLTFHDAYIHAFSSEGTSKLREQWMGELSGTLARKADASTAPPGHPVGTPRKYTEMAVEDVVKQEWEAATRKR